ncbi:hypothetical protein [Mycobacteroides saopaulense]|uniref:WXG100 family type VII secretion target n=1 Tax=Mycobacteroides saopaulense TaxID=1578165 RepID=A0ABX3C3A0_9MYCO|nr:hypothetical protein [Mycobacteroides saopaulense]OHT81315.1 hypothetical protein BKG68_22525 [Mycobacteroides saopaulense]OHU12987.1 hypothetical protein BKG73_05800 [Mycobacteroides saopaulense]
MGKKQIQKEHWEGHDHQSIYNAAQAFQTGSPQAAQESINSIAEQLGDIMHTLGGKVQGMLVEDWRGAAAKSLQANMSEYFRASERGIISIRHVADRMPPLADAMSAAKRSIEPPMSDAQVSQLKKSGSSDADIQQRKNQEQFFARLQMVGLFSEPVVREGDNVTDVRPPQGNNPGNITLQEPTNRPEGTGTGGGNNTGGSGQNGGAGGQGSGDLSKLTNGLADKDTKPAFSDGSGGQGQGQGAGSGGGSGAGGGSTQSGSGGSGSGLGNALSGLAGGLGKDGSGLAPGTTTSAGFNSPSGSGSGTGTLSGPGALRGGPGVPGPGAGGTNPAGIGGAGIRGGGIGMGGMGMAPMGGAHGRGGKGEDDDEHQTPEFLINWDNGNELFGDLPKASPGVIGDWSEHERAEKQRRESEKRRYKSMGWNVDFGDED